MRKFSRSVGTGKEDKDQVLKNDQYTETNPGSIASGESTKPPKEKNVRPNQRESTETKKNRAKNAGRVSRINGKGIDKSKSPRRYNIQSEMAKLKEKGLVDFTNLTDEAATVLEINPLTADALALLGSYGIALNLSLDEDLDLKQDTTDSEVVNNPNIEDKNLKNRKSKKSSAKDKFPDVDDSFYKLGKQQRLMKQKSSSQLAEPLPETAIQTIASALSVSATQEF